MKTGKIFINVMDELDIHIITEALEKNGFTYERGYISSSDEEMTIQRCKDCIGVISGMEPWNEKTLSAVQGKVKMIIRYGTGYNNINLEAAKRYNIAVFNTAGKNAASVAEIALLHILNAGRKFTQSIEFTKQNKYKMLFDTECSELDGKVIGLYGAGAISRNLARMLSGFDVKILAYDIIQNDDIKKYGVVFVEYPEDLFLMSDIISIHIPLLPSTEGIINKHFLSLMKPSSILINTSRGGLINEEDLIEVLKNHKIRFAGLDVVCNEPVTASNPLILMDNVCITPHIAGTTYEAKIRTETLIYKTILSYFQGKYDVEYPNHYLNPPFRF